MRSIVTTLVAIGASAGAVSPAQSQQEQVISVRDGVYTEAQARRGEKTYGDVCIACHIPEWFADGFLDSWNGTRVSALFELISTTMPEDRPGGLKQRQFADVLAYIFQMNGLPAGETELRPDKEVMGKIFIERRE